MYNRLYNFLQKYDILCKYQFGFRQEIRVITDSAVALHCVKAHRQSQWRSPNFNPL